jgi:hypothetical protein
MEANAFAPIFTFTLKVKKYNDAKDNKVDPIDSIVVLIENCIQLRVGTRGGCASTSSNVKVFGLKQQSRLKLKKLD